MKAPARRVVSLRSANTLMERLRSLPAGVRWTGVALLASSVLFTAWLGYEAYQAKTNLEHAHSSARQTKDALLSGKPEEAYRIAEIAQYHANQAQTATHSLPWNLGAAVPLLGSPLKTAQQISDVVVRLADDVLLPGAKMGDGLSPAELIDGTRLDLNTLRDEEPRLAALAAAAEKLDSQADEISNPAYMSLIRNARSQLQDQTSKLAQLLRNTSIAAQLAPPMLGADGPRTYLMAFQTPVEARGTGGVLGAFGLIRFEAGRPIVETLGENSDLRNSLKEKDNAEATIDLGPDFNQAYGWMNPYTDLRNSNVSPHFPYAAQIWKSMWEGSMWARDSGRTLDGVIALDIVALSYILGALGPIAMPDGEVVTKDNVVELTGSTLYLRYPDEKDQPARKDYLQNIAKEIVKKAAEKVQSPRQLLAALGRAVSEGRISIWSSDPGQQKLLEETPLAHIVPNDPAPIAEVVINNLAGNKMDYFLDREIEYAADGCDGEYRNSTITVRLTNTATQPVALSDYHAGTKGLSPDIPITAPTGTMVTSVRLLATKGAQLMSVTSNGERTSVVPRTENGHPSFEIQVAIPPEASGEFVFRLREPTSPGRPRVPIQPLIDQVDPKISVPQCP